MTQAEQDQGNIQGTGDAANQATQGSEETTEKSFADTLYPDSKETEEATIDSKEGEADVDKAAEQPTKEADSAEKKEDAGDKDADDFSSLKIPEENSFVDEKDVEKIAAIAKEHGFSVDAAQKLLDVQNEKVASYKESLVQKVDEQSQKDYESLLKHPELGGENFERTKQLANLALNKIGSPELKQLLLDAGADNNPVLMSFVAKAGELLADDRFILSDAKPVPKTKTFGERMYPQSN